MGIATKRIETRKNAPMTVSFWGVRGGIASPGEHTVRFGGNTACIEVRAGPHTFVIDSGTGARELGRELMARTPVRVHLLFTDYRWDHLQGFPFFTPVYIASSEIHIHGPRFGERGVREMLADQMKFPVFPIQMEHLRAQFSFDTLEDGGSFSVDGVKVTTFGSEPGPAAAPGSQRNALSGSLGYRIDDGTRAVVVLPDGLAGSKDPRLADFCRKASVIVMNSSVPGSLNGERSEATRNLWDFAIALARDARAKRLVLFHHAPDESDHALFALERRARARFSGVHAAYEGLKLAL